MADKRISELTDLDGASVENNDAFAIVDTSTTQTKKISFSELKNALKDYEEGNWTPEFQYATSVTYNSQQGIYRKIGTLVYIEWIINVSSHNTSNSSSIHINLPFAAEANDDVLVTINQSESTILPRSSNSTTPGTGGRIVNLANITFSDAGTSLIQYANTNSSGVFRGAATYISNA